nr:MAG: hypothetical protein [Bacteriophage sp.]
MKVHRIITTIEVENDNSITSIELTKLYPASDCILLAITNMTTNGNAEDITKIYDSVNKSRLGIAGKLKVSLVLLMMVLMITNVVYLVEIITIVNVMMKLKLIN